MVPMTLAWWVLPGGLKDGLDPNPKAAITKKHHHTPLHGVYLPHPTS